MARSCDEWTPADCRSAEVQLGRILEPLAPFKDRLTIVSGLENRHAYGPVHAITPGTWLSGVSPASERAIRRQVQRRTRLPRNTSAGTRCCRRLKSPRKRRRGSRPVRGKATTARALASTISFRGSSTPLPMEFSPRNVFDTLFARGARRPASVPCGARARNEHPRSRCGRYRGFAEAARSFGPRGCAITWTRT